MPRSRTSSTCVMMSVPACSPRSRPYRWQRLLVVPNQMISDFVGLSWSRLEAHHLFILVTQFLMFATASETPVMDEWSESGVSSAYKVVVNMMLFDHCRKVFSVDHKFKWPKDWALWYTAMCVCVCLSVCVSVVCVCVCVCVCFFSP